MKLKPSSFAAFTVAILVVAVIVAAITGTSAWRHDNVRVEKSTQSAPPSK